MKKEKGFTLIEMLIALTVFAFVMAAVYSVISVGLKSRDDTDPGGRRNALAALDAVTSDLRMAMVSPGGGSYFFNGSRSSLDFYALPFGATEPVRFEYYLGDGKSCSGLCRRINTKPLDEKSTKPTEETVSPDAVSFELSYFDGEQWSENWMSPGTLPCAVRISAGAKNKGKFDRFETEVDIPLAQAAQLSQKKNEEKE